MRSRLCAFLFSLLVPATALAIPFESLLDLSGPGVFITAGYGFAGVAFIGDGSGGLVDFVGFGTATGNSLDSIRDGDVSLLFSIEVDAPGDMRLGFGSSVYISSAGNLPDGSPIGPLAASCCTSGHNGGIVLGRILENTPVRFHFTAESSFHDFSSQPPFRLGEFDFLAVRVPEPGTLSLLFLGGALLFRPKFE